MVDTKSSLSLVSLSKFHISNSNNVSSTVAVRESAIFSVKTKYIKFNNKQRELANWNLTPTKSILDKTKKLQNYKPKRRENLKIRGYYCCHDPKEKYLSNYSSFSSKFGSINPKFQKSRLSLVSRPKAQPCATNSVEGFGVRTPTKYSTEAYRCRTNTDTTFHCEPILTKIKPNRPKTRAKTRNTVRKAIKEEKQEGERLRRREYSRGYTLKERRNETLFSNKKVEEHVNVKMDLGKSLLSQACRSVVMLNSEERPYSQNSQTIHLSTFNSCKLGQSNSAKLRSSSKKPSRNADIYTLNRAMTKTFQYNPQLTNFRSNSKAHKALNSKSTTKYQKDFLPNNSKHFSTTLSRAKPPNPSCYKTTKASSKHKKKDAGISRFIGKIRRKVTLKERQAIKMSMKAISEIEKKFGKSLFQ
ncbi:unnamed protein product [Moneuplotes crassus]|uniref:Uncharacterized protein n=1 Tax=Euplotes crassus TaxID=5936 RepID=A0AAD1Y9P4_EUPCR|nr:unnamed protein product [Moneuplotes crassus]